MPRRMRGTKNEPRIIMSPDQLARMWTPGLSAAWYSQPKMDLNVNQQVYPSTQDCHSGCILNQRWCASGYPGYPVRDDTTGGVYCCTSSDACAMANPWANFQPSKLIIGASTTGLKQCGTQRDCGSYANCVNGGCQAKYPFTVAGYLPAQNTSARANLAREWGGVFNSPSISRG